MPRVPSSFLLHGLVMLILSGGAVGILSACSSFEGVGRFQAPDQKPRTFLPRKPPAQRGPASAFMIDWPVDRARLTQTFDLYKARPHWGIDMAAPRGTPIWAAHDGVVIYAGSSFNGYGNLIIIEFDDQWATFYSHLDDFAVDQGDHVERGQEIGWMGDTGRATGVHLHFELRQDRRPVDPLNYLP